jgi:CheY-like chemotaxis protein
MAKEMLTDLHSEKTKRECLAHCNRGRLLLVDDEESIRLLFQMILSENLPDVDIDLASNGLEAMQLFEDRHHGILLIDLHMPLMDGRAVFDSVQTLCRSRYWQMPSFVFCTGFTPPDTILDEIEIDELHCLLPKPISGPQLVDAVRCRLKPGS